MLDDDTRYRLLRLLTEHPNLSQRELASELGLSLGKTNYCLRALIERGWIKVQNFSSSDKKLAYAYVLTPTGVVAKFRATADFLRRKQGRIRAPGTRDRQLRSEVDALSAGADRSANPGI
ncbi:MAG: MarR family EPS-associated transcriptional regulator [Rhodanobacteraceae bacterium]|nr:MarR family EPS-associated transcriptional regulator [Rhodanobacteraceae bacterium]